MGIRGCRPPIVLAFLVAGIFAEVHCHPMEGEVLKLGHMERIKGNILEQLGFMEPPPPAEPLTPDEEETVEAFKDYFTAKEARTVRAKRSINEHPNPKYISTFAGELHKQDTKMNAARTNIVRSAHSQYPDYIVQVYSVQFDLDIQENTTMGRVAQVEILLYQDLPMLHHSDPLLHIEIKVASDGPSPAVSINHVGIEEPGYTTFDLTAVLRPWLTSNPKGPLVLQVSAFCMDSLHCNKPVFDNGLGDKPPKLIISKELEDDYSQQRLKRQSTGPGVGFCQPDSFICCLHPLTINFKEDLGFDFILQPPEFSSNYCEGFCPIFSDPLMTPHLYDFLRRIGSSVEPCCVTHTTQNLEVLQKVNGVLVIEELRNVIVNSCRCG